MRRRLILSTALIALAAVVILGVPLGGLEAARLRADTTSRLEREADAAAGAVDDRLEQHRTIRPALLRRLAARGHRLTVVTSEGRSISTGPAIGPPVLRVHAGSTLRGSVTAEAPSAELDRRTLRMWLLIATLGAGGTITAAALAALQARRLARPLEAIATRSEQLGDGDFSVRAGRFGVPEIDAIARGLDTSAGRIAELVAREREFSANVSHQLRTPLTALRLRLEEAAGAARPDVRAGELEAALAEADRLEATIADLLDHARLATDGRRVAVDVGAVAHEHSSAWQPVFLSAGRGLEVTSGGNVLALASSGTVGQVLDVLLENALRHGAGTVRVDVTSDGRVARGTVSDEGRGLLGEHRERIFARGASQSNGTGIGLSLARALAEADGGGLDVAPGPTTRFELRLPLSHASA